MTVGRAATPLLLLLDAMWCFAGAALFVGAFGQGDGPAPSFLAVAAALLAGFSLTRALQPRAGEASLRALGVAGIVAAVAVIASFEHASPHPFASGAPASFVSDPGGTVSPNAHVVAGIIALFAVSVRGIQDGQRYLAEPAAVASVGLLGLAITALAALTAPATREGVPWGAWAIAYGAVFAGALVVVSAPDPDASLTAFARRWSGLLAALVALAALTMMVAAVFDPGQFGALGVLGAPLRAAGRLLFDYVFVPVFTLLVLPFEGLRLLLESLAGDVKPEPQEPRPPPERPQQDDDQPAWLRALGVALSISFFALLAVGAMAIVWVMLRRITRERPDLRGDRHERVEGSSLRGDLSEIVASLASRLPRRAGRSAVPIRRLYAEVLHDAEAEGYARPPAATPGRFAAELDRRYATDVPSRIAAAFERSRYGGQTIPESEVDQLRRAWRTTAWRNRGDPAGE